MNRMKRKRPDSQVWIQKRKYNKDDSLRKRQDQTQKVSRLCKSIGIRILDFTLKKQYNL